MQKELKELYLRTNKTVKMKVVVFDSETNGLIRYKNADTCDTELFPYIVQFSYIFYDTETNEILNMRDEIIKIPEDEEIDTICVSIHGISKKISEKKGSYIENILLNFMEDFKKADLIVAHNIQFDYKLTIVELTRVLNRCYKGNRLFEKVKESLEILKNTNKNYCTMREGMNICNIWKTNKLNQAYKKFPKLSELHEKLFEYIPQNLHNSMNDVVICLRCFYKIKFDKDICEYNQKIKKMMIPLTMSMNPSINE